MRVGVCADGHVAVGAMSSPVAARSGAASAGSAARVSVASMSPMKMGIADALPGPIKNILSRKPKPVERRSGLFHCVSILLFHCKYKYSNKYQQLPLMYY